MQETVTSQREKHFLLNLQYQQIDAAKFTEKYRQKFNSNIALGMFSLCSSNHVQEEII